jgi:phosphate-selective porin OprO/OprP
VYQGKLRKSTLEVRASDIDELTEHPTWSAYTPPPVSLPTSRDAGASWNHWDTKQTKNVFFAILALDRQAWLSQDSASQEQVGSLDLFEGGEIRDLRMGIFGTLNFFDRPWGYNISFSSNAFDKEFEEGRLTSCKAIDYRLDIPIGDSLSLSLGKQKEPISMERTMSLVNLPMQERSTSAAFLPGRSFGAQLSGNALKGRLSSAAGAFNNFIDEDAAFSEATSSVSGRVTWATLLSEDRSNVLHLAIAGRVSDDGPPVRFNSKPEFNKAPIFIDTDILATNRVEQLSLESSWRRGPFWLAAEHLTTAVETPAEGRLNLSGYYVMASWIVTGEMRAFQQRNGTFGAVPVAQPTSTNGPGAWELALRWSDIDLDDGPIQGGDMNVLSLGTSWWWTSTSNLSLNYRYVVNDRGGLTGESNGANLRLLLKLN